MSTSEFEIRVDGGPATFDDVLPEFTVNDRIGVVTQSPGGSLAAAPLLLASVARYYELLRDQGDEFYRYPGYYVIHVGRQHAYHGWLDVWSANKEVVVAPHGEAVLEALNDRAITRVVLEDAGNAPGELMRENVNWLLKDVRDVLTYVPGIGHGGITIKPSDPAAELIARAARASHGVLSDEGIEEIVGRSGQPQAFNRIACSDALGQLCAYGPTPGVLGQDADYLRRHGADESTMRPHRFSVG
jgi:hypothetical protein